MPWHSRPIEKILEEFKTDAQNGLSDIEVKKRLREFGPNQLPEEKPISKIRLLIEQLKSPLIYILVIAGFITIILREYTDAIVIFGAVILNTVVGYLQENKAGQALRVLKKVIKVRAVVFRQGEEKEIFQEELVPGDLILLAPGNKVPADGRLISAWNLKINESVLTGEWLPAEKNTEILKEDTPLADRDNMVYMGTVVEDGRGRVVVTATGCGTEIGKIAGALKETKEEKTPYQKKLSHFGKIVGIIITALCLGIFVEGMLTGGEFIEMFTTAVAIAVAAIPEGLPVAMTVILAIGMQKILKKKGLVRHLASVETLGSTSIICTDKTGTLTEAKMEVAGIYTADREILSDGKKYQEKIDRDGKDSHVMVLKIATLCNDAFIENLNEPMEKWVLRGRPTEKSLLLAGVQAGLDKRDLERKEPKLDELPFDPVYKYSATLHKFTDSEDLLYVMGAPEIILEMSQSLEIDGDQKLISPERLGNLKRKYEGLTLKGFRLVATAYKKIKRGSLLERIEGAFGAEPFDQFARQKIYEEDLKEMVFVGFVALHDPIRPDAGEAMEICRQAGIKPIIITGDHRLTAKAVADKLGFDVKDEDVLEGKELEKLSDEEFEKRFKNIQIYARVEPQQKSRIVQAWQKAGEVVAMTGDGVNDAPALKRADIGVALGSGTDVAKEVSDLVLLSDNFSIIVAAVEEGRAIIDNIRKVITYLLTDSFTEVILVGVSLVLGWPLPVLAAQILWINLIEDGLPNIALAFEPKEKGLMRGKPQGLKTPLLISEMKALIFIIGLFTDLLLLGLFAYLLKFSGYEIGHIRSIIFAGLAIDSLFYVFSCKSLKRNIWRINPFSNKFLVGAWIFGVIMLLGALYVPVLQVILKTQPLNSFDWGLLLGLGIINLILIEATKWYFISRHKTQ